ncbi:hypothetical protein Ocin01_17927, partial [Orchesella cincta]
NHTTFNSICRHFMFSHGIPSFISNAFSISTKMPIRCCNPCPCMPLKLAVILVAIVDAGLKLIASFVVRSSLADLDEFLKYADFEEPPRPGPTTEEKWAPIRNQHVAFLVVSAFGVFFAMVLLFGALLTQTKLCYAWVVGSILTLILYLTLFGIEYKEKTKEQYFFNTDTVYMLIWKLGVKTVPFIYYTFVVLAFINQVGEEMREPRQSGGEETVQGGSPPQDQPVDQPTNVKTEIVNP